MATDYFIGYTIADKLALLKGLSESIMTGQVVRVQTAHGVYTEFSPNISNELTYQRLCDSIVMDDAFDSTDPLQAACLKNQRASSTRVLFNANGNCSGAWRGNC